MQYVVNRVITTEEVYKFFNQIRSIFFPNILNLLVLYSFRLVKLQPPLNQNETPVAAAVSNLKLFNSLKLINGTMLLARKLLKPGE